MWCNLFPAHVCSRDAVQSRFFAGKRAPDENPKRSRDIIHNLIGFMSTKLHRTKHNNVAIDRAHFHRLCAMLCGCRWHQWSCESSTASRLTQFAAANRPEPSYMRRFSQLDRVCAHTGSYGLVLCSLQSDVVECDWSTLAKIVRALELSLGVFVLCVSVCISHSDGSARTSREYQRHFAHSEACAHHIWW